MPIRLKPLAEQVMLITGASSGIGLETARRAGAAGAKVMLVSRDGPALAEAAAAIRAAGGEADHHVADVADAVQLEAAAAAAVARFGRIDTWVNDAGVTLYGHLIETPEDQHRRMFDVNYFGTVNAARAAVPRLREKGGALIVVGSVVGDMPAPVMGAYSASKHAVKGFVESLRIELQAEGAPISLTLIKPSGISTPIAANAPNHEPGEPRLPPPVYDPSLVADAILDAAVRPRRSRVVGGAGRLQSLVYEHAPGLSARLATAMIPLLSDPDGRQDPAGNFDRPRHGGQARSAKQPGRRWSVYQALTARPWATAAALAGAAGLGAWAARRR